MLTILITQQQLFCDTITAFWQAGGNVKDIKLPSQYWWVRT